LRSRLVASEDANEVRGLLRALFDGAEVSAGAEAVF
jgi:hypothetical protein